MGFATPVELGTAAPACVTLGADATVEEKRVRKEMVAVVAIGPDGKHGQTKVKRIKYSLTARGRGTASANSTEVGTSEATAIIDFLDDGDKNEEYSEWSVEAHWYTDPV